MTTDTIPTVEQAKEALLAHVAAEPQVPGHLRYLETPEWRAYEDWNMKLMRLVNDLRRAREGRETT
jgi:hypothetical protein